MIMKIAIKLMQLGVGITALVGVSGALSGLPVIGAPLTWIKNKSEELLTIPYVGPVVGTLGGLGILLGFYRIATGRDIYGLGQAAFKPGAGLQEVAGAGKKLVSTVGL